MRKLKELADIVPSLTIRTGMYDRAKLDLLTTGIVSAQHVKDDGTLDMERGFATYGERSHESANPRHYLNEGDVVIVARGDRQKACVVPGVDLHSLVASTSVIVLRPKPELLGPYLVAIVNADERGFFRRVLQGTNIQALKPKEALELEVPLPSLEDQERVAGVFALSMRLLVAHKKAHELRMELVRSTAHHKDVKDDGHT